MSKFEPISRGEAAKLWVEGDERVRIGTYGGWQPLDGLVAAIFRNCPYKFALEVPDPKPGRVVVKTVADRIGPAMDDAIHEKRYWDHLDNGTPLTIVIQSTADYEEEEKVLREWWESWEHTAVCADCGTPSDRLFNLLIKRFGAEVKR